MVAPSSCVGSEQGMEDVDDGARGRGCARQRKHSRCLYGGRLLVGGRADPCRNPLDATSYFQNILKRRRAVCMTAEGSMWGL